jgi:hypothetical protein
VHRLVDDVLTCPFSSAYSGAADPNIMEMCKANIEASKATTEVSKAIVAVSADYAGVANKQSDAMIAVSNAGASSNQVAFALACARI